MTSTVEDSRASRLTSVTTRDISSAECSEAKKASGMRLDVGVQLAADAGDDPLADRRHQVGLAEAADRP